MNSTYLSMSLISLVGCLGYTRIGNGANFRYKSSCASEDEIESVAYILSCVISDMRHDDVSKDTSVNEEGNVSLLPLSFETNLTSTTCIKIVQCNVGDWVEVKWDYSPGICSEGSTGVVIALTEGMSLQTCFNNQRFMMYSMHRSCNSKIHLRTSD